MKPSSLDQASSVVDSTSKHESLMQNLSKAASLRISTLLAIMFVLVGCDPEKYEEYRKMAEEQDKVLMFAGEIVTPEMIKNMSPQDQARVLEEYLRMVRDTSEAQSNNFPDGNGRGGTNDNDRTQSEQDYHGNRGSNGRSSEGRGAQEGDQSSRRGQDGQGQRNGQNGQQSSVQQRSGLRGGVFLPVDQNTAGYSTRVSDGCSASTTWNTQRGIQNSSSSVQPHVQFGTSHQQNTQQNNFQQNSGQYYHHDRVWMPQPKNLGGAQ